MQVIKNASGSHCRGQVLFFFCFSSLYYYYAVQNYAAKINYAPPSQIVKCLQSGAERRIPCKLSVVKVISKYFKESEKNAPKMLFSISLNCNPLYPAAFLRAGYTNMQFFCVYGRVNVFGTWNP